MNNNFKNVLSRFGIYFVLLAMVVYFSFASEAFLTQANIFNILRQVAVVGIAAVGMTFVMLTGGIDLSVGSIIGVSGIITASLMVAGVHPVLAVVIALICGAVMGFFNALIINKFKVPALIVTLGMVTSLRGVAYMVTGGLPVFGFPESFSLLGQGYMWIIPVPVIIMVVTFIIGYIILEKFSIGRYIYGVGGNEEASRLSGISVERIKYFVYSMSGFLCALAGVVLLSRTNSGQPKAGTGYEMDIITAVVLGGVSITGGEGKITSVIAGVLIMGILSNGMIITNVGDYAQRIVQGMVLIIAVAFDIYQKNRKTTLKDVVNLENA
ncbi:MAG: ABC transporter permease [Vallitaleaceae bacterium]|nr:ABC transporter permease [Vallitaleaceae bacterium]